MRPPVRRAFNWRLKEIAEGGGMGRFFSLKLNQMHMLHGPVIPEETSKRYIIVPGHTWDIRDFGDPDPANGMQVVVHQRTFKQYEFGVGWWHMVKKKNLEVGEVVGFQVAQDLRVMHLIRGEEAVKNFRPTEYPIPYIRGLDYLGLPRIYRQSKFSVFTYLRQTNPWGIDKEQWDNRTYSENTELMAGLHYEKNLRASHQQKKKEYFDKMPIFRDAPKAPSSHYRNTVHDARLHRYNRGDKRDKQQR